MWFPGLRQRKLHVALLRFLGMSAACLLFSVYAVNAFSAWSQNALIVNEYNAVDSGKYLDKKTYSESTKEDSYFKTISGLPDGRIQGNGGNWVELVVTQDHLNIQGWSLRWVSTDNAAATKADKVNDYWYGSNAYEQGIITFSNTAGVWSDLRAGTIITLSQKQLIAVDTTLDGSNRNFTDSPLPSTAEVNIDLSTNTSFNPAANDWWIHACTTQEQSGSQLVTTVTNVTGDTAGDFSVGPDNWEMRILDQDLNVVSGPVGEAITGWSGGVNGNEVGKLQTDPSGSVTLANYSDGASSSFGMANVWTTSGISYEQDFSPLRAVVPEPGTMILLIAGSLAWLLVRQRRAAR